MIKSEDIKELAAALAKAQGQIEGAKKDTVNPFFKSKYADLASVWDAIRKPLSDNGLSIIQTTRPPTKEEDNFMVLNTTLMHSSGQWVSSAIPVVAKDQTPQAMGSALTYSRRYSLAAIVGVYQEDDDANAAQKIQQSPVQQRPQTKPPYPVADHRAEPPPRTQP